MGALVEINNVYKIYNPGENEVRALDGVSVSIEEGEFVAIIGQSGSGKSTLMNILGCLDVPSAGQYWLHGQNVSELYDDELSDIRNREIGFIFQGFNLIPNLTALENVELPLIYRGVGKGKRRELAEIALDKVGLGHRMDHKPAEMSGGQQQRVAIARAIAQAPPIILADEPTGNLDSRSTGEIMEILKELHEEGRTVILITHDNEIAARARRVIKIKDGKIEADYISQPQEGAIHTEAISQTDNATAAGETEETDNTTAAGEIAETDKMTETDTTTETGRQLAEDANKRDNKQGV